MLTDVALKNLKPRAKPFKVADRDGMYAHVATSGLVTFRLDYRMNGRRETVVLGRYSRDGLTLALERLTQPSFGLVWFPCGWHGEAAGS